MSVEFTIKPVDDKGGRQQRRRTKKVKSDNEVKQVKMMKSVDEPMGREELGRWLWKAADILRGAVRAEDYGDFMLPLLFFKRLSDEFLERRQRALKEYGEEYADDAMFYRAVIPEGCTWEDIRATSVNVGATLNNVLNTIARENPVLDRVINRVDFNDQNAIPEERLVRLIEHFSQRNLSNGNVSPDMLGDGYEYLLKMFNEAAPKRAGEFYTPREVVRVLVECLKPEEGMTVYDPCCGTAGMLIESYYHLKREDKDSSKLFLYGQEINDDTWAMAQMNVFLHGMEAEIVQGDTFVNPRFLEGGGLKRFDVVIANPMWNQKGFKQYMEDDQYGRFEYGIATNSSADWGWIQHMLASLEDTGRMGVVLDQGALFRGGAEGKVRRAVLEKDFVDCVVALPEKLFYNTGAPGCLIFLNKEKPEERKGRVLFIYAARDYEKISNMNQLREEDINSIESTYTDYMDSEKYSQLVEFKEIKENDYNLSVTRYVDIFDPPEPVDIQQVWNQLKELEKQRQEEEEKIREYMREIGIES